jgi:DNA repair protein RecN (Recombination protein N)
MLQQLTINNYALIQNASLGFGNGLQIITGETGSGKSIILGALGLLLGERNTQTSTEKCTVEAVFKNLNSPELLQFFEQNDIENEPEVIIRREISAAGKSRAFINDSPVNLSQLALATDYLIDVHRQYDAQELSDTGFKIKVLDALADNNKLFENYQAAYTTYKNALAAFNQLQQQQTEWQKNYDYQSFLYNELEQASFTNNEIENADAEWKLLQNATGIINSLQLIQHSLYEKEEATSLQIKQLVQQLAPYTSQSTAINELQQRLLSVYNELTDLATEAGHLADKFNADPERLNWLNERINLGNKLLKKHGFTQTDELIALQKELQLQIDTAAASNDKLFELEKEKEKSLAIVQKLAIELTKKRQAAVTDMEAQLGALLKQVGMPNAQLKISITPTQINSWGGDVVEYLFDANRSNNFLPVQKCASGGERSRLMLCIKSLVAHKMDMSTMVFDEIDSGISGEACKQVAILLQNMAGHKQIICITHQPQIAAKAQKHFLVQKTLQPPIRTYIQELQPNEKIVAIAKMIGGEKPSDAVMESVREMMG